MRQIIIVEGGELSGKSWIISQLYPLLESQGSASPNFLNGCIWFNCDVGLLGDTYGPLLLEHYLRLAEEVPDRTILWEKFHISDQAYRQFYQLPKISYNAMEGRLLALGAKIIFCRVSPDEAVFQQRLADRLRLYPHYQRIAKTPADYLRLQTIYQQLIRESRLPILTVDATKLPNPEAIAPIINWLTPQ